MVSEIILAVKERNKQTRATAFELLVQARCTQMRVVGWAGNPLRQCPELHTSLYAPRACITRALSSLQIAHAMHEAEPPPPGLGLGGDAAMAGDGESAAALDVHLLTCPRHTAWQPVLVGRPKRKLQQLHHAVTRSISHPPLSVAQAPPRSAAACTRCSPWCWAAWWAPHRT